MANTPTDLFPAIATIVAALIAGLFSFLNLVISKEQKVSEFRQVWIDKLREEISQYIAAVNYVSNSSEAWVREGSQQELEHRKALQASHMLASQTYTSILLRMNAADNDMTFLVKKEEFVSALTAIRHAIEEGTYEKATSLVDDLRDRAQPVLKHEWERVKKGEPIYRGTQIVAAVIVLFALLAGSSLAYWSVKTRGGRSLAAPNAQSVQQTR
jgi:hypothetical protein